MMNMMIPMSSETYSHTPGVKEVNSFLSEYSAMLLGCGATCIRIQKNVQRMAIAFGVEVEMTIMPTHILLTVWNKEHTHSYSSIRQLCKGGIHFHINTKLSKLSWEVADGKVTFMEAQSRIRDIANTPHSNPCVVLILASCANASFCRLFNGDGISVLIVFVATMGGYFLKQIMLDVKMDIRFVFFCSAFMSSVIAAAGYVFDWGNTPDVAIGTSVLYLIPGVPYINCMSDMLDGHYVCSFSRFMNAAILTFCLSAGLCGGLLVMNLRWF